MMPADGDLRTSLARAMRVLGRLGSADLMSFVAARIPGTTRLAMTPGWSGGPPAPHRTEPGDILVLDRDGSVVEGHAPPSPFAAAALACSRLRSGAEAVAFVCPPLTCAFGMTARPLLPLPHMGGELGARIALDDGPGLPVTAARAEEMIRAAGDAPIVHLPGIGLLVMGPDVISILSTVYTLEYSVARANMVAAQLPTPGLRLLREEELTRIVGQRAGHGAYEAFFGAVDRPPAKPAAAQPGSPEDAIRRKMVISCRILHAQQTLVAFLEHISHRLDGQRWLMSPAIHFGTMTAEDMITLDERAERLSGPPPALFRFYHRDILARRPEINAIVHTHDIYGRMFIQAGIAPQPVWRNGALQCGEPLPVFPQADLLFDEVTRQGAVAALDGHPAVHELGHGTDFVAPTLEEATVRAVQREELLRAQFRAIQLGTPVVLGRRTLADLAACAPGWDAWWAYYAALESDGVPAPGVAAGW